LQQGLLPMGRLTAPQSGPSDLLDVYKNATTTWVSTAFGYANKLFGFSHSSISLGQ
jgi:hypothetical protein